VLVIFYAGCLEGDSQQVTGTMFHDRGRCPIEANYDLYSMCIPHHSPFSLPAFNEWHRHIWRVRRAVRRGMCYLDGTGVAQSARQGIKQLDLSSDCHWNPVKSPKVSLKKCQRQAGKWKSVRPWCTARDGVRQGRRGARSSQCGDVRANTTGAAPAGQGVVESKHSTDV
jgi:hypothetical protein